MASRGHRTPSCLAVAFWLLVALRAALANEDAKRLYDDLLNGYNSLIRPVGNNSDRLTVKMGLKLSQLIDVNLKNQIMTTNVWVEQEWNDYKLRWEPDEYGGVSKLHVPADQIWLPDIVLYNNADGNYEVTIMTKAILHSDGQVIWKPPAIYKSSCEIDVEFFPFDQQTCFMKFGSWTYDGYTVDLKHKYQNGDSPEIKIGIDLSEFYLSVEWDIMAVPARRKEKYYSCCEEPYPDITFNVTLRRKTLFYTVNLIIPCILISALSVLVFYLPSDSGEKVSLSISIMLSLGVFFLLLAEIIPPTSLTVPLLGRYLLFTMVVVTLSVMVTIAVLNVNFRSPSTHRMAPWVRRVFLEFLPPILCMDRPLQEEPDAETKDRNGSANGAGGNGGPHGPIVMQALEKSALVSPGMYSYRRDSIESGEGSGSGDFPAPPMLPPDKYPSGFGRAEGLNPMCYMSHNGATNGHTPPPYNIVVHANDVAAGFRPDGPTLPVDDELEAPMLGSSIEGGEADRRQPRSELEHALLSVRFVAQHMENLDNYCEVEEEWKFVALVLDRLFLWIFAIVVIGGTAGIILQAPTLYDTNQPIDVILSKLAHLRRMLN